MAGRERKNSLKELFSGGMAPAAPLTPEILRAPEIKSVEPAPAPEEPPAPPPARAASGAVKAMGLSLNSMAKEVEEARVLRQALQDGERVVQIETDRITESFVNDRLSDEERDDPDFLALIDSIRESGQQVPILVRPSDEPGRYQVAYGHRRLKAARRLGRPVTAIVKVLSDDELVLAQGKENAERRNLSFIERAMFARTLSERGFDRKLVSEALGGLLKSEMSRLLQVAEAIPPVITHAIGPAPKAGRDRWMALAELFLTGKGAEEAKALDEIAGEHFRRADTNDRFQMLFKRLMRNEPPRKADAVPLTSPDGHVFARMEHKGKGLKITFADEVEEGFIAAVRDRLVADYAVYRAAAGKRPDKS